jgi:hypothetical protein
VITTWENETRSPRATNAQRPLTHSLDHREEGLAVQATRKCAVADCDIPVEHRDWCEGHYRRWLGHGDPLGGRRSPAPSRCSVEGCVRRSKARTWCKLHYYRWKRTGEVGPVNVELDSRRLPGPQSMFWKGKALTYSGAHSRVLATRGPAKQYPCADCAQPAVHWSYAHTDPNEMREPIKEGGKPYSPRPEHYEPRCVSCHVRFDNRMRRLARR